MIKKEILKFSPEIKTSFYTELRKKVYGYFKENNISLYANWQMRSKTALFFTLFGVSYYIILFTNITAYLKIIACILHGLAIAGIGFNIAHDAGHGAYSKSKKTNRLLFYTMDLVGSNSYMWDIKHNKAHHIYTNIDAFDEDIRGSKLLRLSPHAPLYSINRHQHIYAWFLYCFLYFFIVWFYNFQQFKAAAFGPFRNMQHSGKEWVQLVTWKLFYLFYAIVVPFAFLKIPVSQFLIGYSIVCATTGFLLGLIFYLAHCVEKTASFPLPEQDAIKIDWALHQMNTTCNFGTGNKLLTWFCGGLNFQIEHHLFPEICSIHYKEISKIVSETAKEFNTPYLQYVSFSEAVISHYKMLKQLGK